MNGNKLNFKSYCTAKETIHQKKRQPTNREKILANDMTDKGLISKTYKQLIQGKAAVYGVTQSRTRLKQLSSSSILFLNVYNVYAVVIMNGFSHLFTYPQNFLGNLT